MVRYLHILSKPIVMKKTNLLLLLLPFFSLILRAQTPVENLQNGVETYNALKAYAEGFKPETATEEVMTDIKTRLNKGVALLDKVIKEGTAEQIRTARYFKTMFYNEQAFMFGMKGDNRRALEVYKTIEADMSNYTEADFPLRYVFFEKNFVIKWENFGATQAEFLTGLSEVYYNMSQYEDALRLARKALKHPNMGEWLRYIALNKTLDIAAKRPDLLPENEKLDIAVQSIFAYDKLSESNKETVAKNNYPKCKRSMSLLLEDVQRKNNRESALRAAEALPVLSRLEAGSLTVLQLYEACYKNGVPGDMAFAENADAYARNMQSADAARANFVGISAVDRIAALKASNDCEGLRQIAERYNFWKQSAKVQQYNKQADKCLEERQAAARKAARAAKRSNSDFNFYVGAYLFPLLNSNPKRDYGAAANFVFKKAAIEVSYLKINQNKENTFDMWAREVDDAKWDNLSRWDGFYAHIQPKFFSDKTTYWGFLAGYAQKNFEPTTVTAINDATQVPQSATFDPSVKQYIGMLNIGVMGLGKGVGMDLYMGIGANYSQFTDGGSIDRNVYTITDNPLLENRKDAYFGLIMRFGMTVGLNLGKGR